MSIDELTPDCTRSLAHGHRWSDNQDGVVLAWLLRIVVVGGLMAAVLFDTGAILVNNIQLQETADEVASKVSTSVMEGGISPADKVALGTAARALARPQGVKVARATVDAQGVFHLRIKRDSNSIIAGHIGALRGLTEGTASGEAATT